MSSLKKSVAYLCLILDPEEDLHLFPLPELLGNEGITLWARMHSVREKVNKARLHKIREEIDAGNIDAFAGFTGKRPKGFQGPVCLFVGNREGADEECGGDGFGPCDKAQNVIAQGSCTCSALDVHCACAEGQAGANARHEAGSVFLLEAGLYLGELLPAGAKVVECGRGKAEGTFTGAKERQSGDKASGLFAVVHPQGDGIAKEEPGICVFASQDFPPCQGKIGGFEPSLALCWRPFSSAVPHPCQFGICRRNCGKAVALGRPVHRPGLTQSFVPGIACLPKVLIFLWIRVRGLS